MKHITKKMTLAVMVVGLLGSSLVFALPKRTLAAAGQLDSGQWLGSGQTLYSPDGHYMLRMQGDGNLVQLSWPRVLWASNTAGRSGAALVMQGDGNLVLYAPGNVAIWASNTAGKPGAVLQLQNDANMVIRYQGNVIWASGATDSRLDAGQRLNPGWQIQSPNRAYRIVMQGDGNLVLYSGSTAVWASNTFKSGSTLEMQGDGNLVVYAPGHLAVWSTNTFTGNSAFVGQNDRNFVVYAPGNVAKWSTGTSTGTPANLTPTTSLSSCPTMTQGMSGSCVALLQKYLNWANSSPRLSVDGMFGSLTRQSVVYFQGTHGLVADGVVGAQTKTALINATSVATPKPAAGHAYPSTFSPNTAASWAMANAQTQAPGGDQRDVPCTQFMSRALQAAGMQLDGDWYPNTDAVWVYIGGYNKPAWYGVQAFRSRLINKGWVNQYSMYPGSSAYPVAVGDIIYYEWNGQATTDHVHLAMVTKIEGGVIYVTDQGSKTGYAVNRRWDIGRAGNNLRTDFPNMKAYVIHWR